MSEDERAKLGAQDEAQDEVEGHRARAGANEEGADEAADGDDDDVEAHRKLV
jgi:hypothetical protein